MTMTLIEHIELGSTQSSITFSSIAADFTDLYITASIRSNNTSVTGQGGWDPFIYRINDSDTGYSARNLWAQSSTVTSDTLATRSSNTYVSGTWGRFGEYGIANANTTANTFTSVSIYIPNYASSNAKSYSSELAKEINDANNYMHMTANLWNNTDAITSISFALGVGQYVSGSTFTLYGIAAGSDGTTTVS